MFSLRHLWFNFRVYFLEPACWRSHFPFVNEITVPPRPSGHGIVEQPFGVLTNIPLVWLALAAPLAWRSRSVESRSTLRGLLAALAMLFGIGALTLCLFYYTASRYEVEFLPALVLLAVVGALGLERTLAVRPVHRRIARRACGALFIFSLAFNLLASVMLCSNEWWTSGIVLAQAGHVPEAIQAYEAALWLRPDSAGAHNDLGVALQKTGQIKEAIEHFEMALRLKADYAAAHYNLGNALLQTRRVPEAVQHYEQALRITPDYAEAHNNLGTALATQGRLQEAIQHYEQALQIEPDLAGARKNLEWALSQLGKTP